MRKSKKLIPYGMYCFDYKNNKRCPYWSRDISSKRNAHENGFCSYINKSDWDLNEIKTTITQWTKEDEKVFKDTSWHDLGLNESLLWDQCKECGIHEETLLGKIRRFFDR